MFKDNLSIIAFEKDEIGRSNVLDHDIKLNLDAIPIAKKPYKTAPKELEFL